ncbi:MAG TPA: ribonuclease III [Termitinemataceae bacterium]|nr:ribonuclease III [Termitinemataceae bacterium]
MPTNLLNLNKNKLPSLPPVDGDRRRVLQDFLRRANLRFRSLELLNLSFIHRSATNELPIKVNNERLEFLGDAVIGLITASILYERLPEKPEGELAKIKSVVVSEDILSGRARELGIDSLLILGKGEELSGGRTKKALLADALEALVGAIYLDGGFTHTFEFVGPFIQEEIEQVLSQRHHQDYKTLLQEWCQHWYRSYPQYRLVKKIGPDHDRLFWVEVQVQEKVYGPATGKNKKEAEQAAARLAYTDLTKGEANT